MDDRSRAAHELGLHRSRRGIGALESLATRLQRVVEAYQEEWGGPSERRLLGAILITLGYMDTPRSHAHLARLIRESTSHVVRADALEAVAFEKEQFDFDLVLPFALDRSHPAEILSALYALEFHNYANVRPEEARAVVRPLLVHPYPMVPVFGIGLLMFRASNLDLILPLANDPNEHIRKAVVEAVEFISAPDSE